MKQTFPVPEFFLLSILLFCFASSAFGSDATLVQDEVQALKDIAKTLGKENWEFNVDPCSGLNNWTTLNPVKGAENNVSCDCSFAKGTLCHVVGIILKQQNLPGTLPPELTRLPYLQEIDLTRNYLNGTIPKQWGSLNLVNISLLGNRLTGTIPVELTNITTLKSLVLEFNEFYGNLPPQLGDLSQIERLHLTSNNFTGELPATLARLTTLMDVRIGDNQFSGKIPNFIQNWTNLDKLIIQGSGLSGPIPSEISFLQNLTDLRISDLNGPHSTFPQLDNMSMRTLILRSCNINGTLPAYLGNMTTLKVLDLSYNQLSGEIPSTFSSLRKVDNIYLTGNHLTRSVPSWTDKVESIDLSYNNFSTGNTGQQICHKENVNLFASFSKGNDSGTDFCVESIGCSKTPRYSLYINCGGNKVTNGHTTYDDDSDATGPATFRQQSETNWAFSNTGHFLDNEGSVIYTRSNNTRLSITDAQLYMTARVSAISLTYYGFCLANPCISPFCGDYVH